MLVDNESHSSRPAALRARLLIEPVTAPMPTKTESDEWIAEAAAIARFGLDATWLRRHRAALRARRIISGSRKKRVITPAGCRRFLRRKPGKRRSGPRNATTLQAAMCSRNRLHSARPMGASKTERKRS